MNYNEKITTRNEARQKKLKRFYSGVLCPKGHDSERLTSNGTCLKCSKERLAKWYRKKQEDKIIKGATTRCEAKKTGKTRYNTKKPCSKGHLSERRVSDAKCMECVREKNRKRNKNNKEYFKEHIKAWKKNNRDAVKASWQKRRTKCKNSFKKQDIENLRVRQKGLCVYCKSDINKRYHIDHIMPLALGGDNSVLNIQLLCPNCNLRKAAKHPIDWAQQEGFLL